MKIPAWFQALMNFLSLAVLLGFAWVLMLLVPLWPWNLHPSYWEACLITGFLGAASLDRGTLERHWAEWRHRG